MSAKLHPPRRPSQPQPNPLPPLVQTPSGLALLELQGTINLPQSMDGEALAGVEIGSIDFPDYTPGADGSAWTRRVQMYVGQHQRLMGEVRKLPRPVAVIRRRENRLLENSAGTYMEQGENLEVVEIVKFKIMFSNRPEPVGTAGAP
ncbi:hypothetical protein ED733_003786 [Metarhizium rileyi]|uniref:Chromosome transmission fidelity protein 8 n=1 Tax=Metarhizium rileyi (strain RCEF 4871) TaxID=1649241 RepID=A0A5C6GBQ6_METRR|nr:hypothetical protein ED733_003786 [Metarhizium rileyi]